MCKTNSSVEFDYTSTLFMDNKKDLQIMPPNYLHTTNINAPVKINFNQMIYKH